MKRKLRVLLDVDGVLTTGFLDYACELLRERGFSEAHPGNVSQWDFMAQFDIPRYVEEEVNAILAQPGMYDRFKPSEWGRLFVQSMRLAGHDVYALTAPWSGKTWHSDRDAWLLKHFGIQRKRVIHCSDKFVVSGDVLLDDRAENVQRWQEANPRGLGILWRQPSNRNDTAKYDAHSFDEVRSLITTFYEE